MTEQMPDWVFYDGIRFSLEWDSTGKLPLLSELGVHPLNISPATRRGYEAEYEIADNRLFLTRLVVGDIQFLANFAPIGDVEPVVEYNYLIDGKPTKDIGDVVYYLKYPMSIDGTIVIDCWGIDDRNLPPKEHFKTEFERKTLKLKLVSGQISTIRAISSEMSAVRKAMEDCRKALMARVEKGEMSVIEYALYDDDDLKALRQKYQGLIQEELE